MRMMAQRTGMIAWLTLAVSLMITGDLVMDLVFEGPDLTTSADASSMPEEPDNAAEHILMPSQKADGSTEVSLRFGIVAAAAASLLSTYLQPPAAQHQGPIHERPPRSSPAPLLLPLRI